MSSKKIISNQLTHTPLPPPHNPPLQSQFYNNWANPRALIASDWSRAMPYGAAENATSSSEGQRFLKSSKMADTVRTLSNRKLLLFFCEDVCVFSFILIKI